MRQRFAGGRPRLPEGQRTVLVGVSILPTQKTWATRYGEGNLSLGVRRAIVLAMQGAAPEVIAAEAARRAAEAADLARAAKEVEHLVYGEMSTSENIVERLRTESEEKEKAFLSCSRERARIATDRQRLQAALKEIALGYCGALAAYKIAQEAIKYKP